MVLLLRRPAFLIAVGGREGAPPPPAKQVLGSYYKNPKNPIRIIPAPTVDLWQVSRCMMADIGNLNRNMLRMIGRQPPLQEE